MSILFFKAHFYLLLRLRQMLHWLCQVLFSCPWWFSPDFFWTTRKCDKIKAIVAVEFSHYVLLSSVPFYFLWLRYISWFNYANEALIINQWRNIDSISCSSALNSTRCFKNGDDVIKFFNMDKVLQKTESFLLDWKFFLLKGWFCEKHTLDSCHNCDLASISILRAFD